MKSTLTVIIATAACCVGLGFMASYTAVFRINPSEVGEYGSDLRDARAFQSRRAAELLKVQTGLVSHYDRLVENEKRLRVTCKKLLAPPGFLSPDARDDLRDQAKRLSQMREESEKLIEKLKSNHSVLRNSLRHLTVLAAEFADAHAVPVAQEQATQIALQRVIRAVLLLQIEYSDAALRRTAETVQRLRQEADSQPPVGSTDIDLVLRHTDIVYRKSRDAGELTRSLEMIPLDSAIGTMLTQFGLYEQDAHARARGRTAVLFTLSLFSLALGAGYVIYRLRKSAQVLRLSEEEMRRAMERQTELSNLKTRFVSMTSHEFRTPLSRVVSSSEMLTAYRGSWPEEKIETHLKRIRESALGMTKMLDSILLIGRSDAGMLNFVPQQLELRGFCEDLIEAVEQSTGARDRIRLTLEEECSIWGDEGLLRHALENLLTNAVKYSSPPAPVTLTVKVVEGEAEFSVKDEGIGIPEQDLPHLFESFHRGTNVGKISGTGLGLSIVKRAIDFHHGSVSVESRMGEGSAFSVRIPASEEVA